MYQVVINFDKYAGHFQVTVTKEKRLWIFKYKTMISRYRGPVKWVCKKAIELGEQYGVEVIDNTI
ncbi:hypothetical protein DIU36_24685 [Mucilaginibacter rubeus]|nr:hypothetical protein DIU36_24685 [Mucilaginibacter rubeus]